MEVLAIEEIVKQVTAKRDPVAISATLNPDLNGMIEQFQHRQDTPGAVFLINIELFAKAEAELDTLPLVARGK